MSRESHEASFYCSECGVSMATRKQLKKHQRCHKTISEKLMSGTVRRVSSVAAGSECLLKCFLENDSFQNLYYSLVFPT